MPTRSRTESMTSDSELRSPSSSVGGQSAPSPLLLGLSPTPRSFYYRLDLWRPMRRPLDLDQDRNTTCERPTSDINQPAVHDHPRRSWHGIKLEL
jgi:hypothetical protein